MLLNNQSIISNYSNINFDFKNYLEMKDSLIFKNCRELKIKINSKINKLIFLNCNDIALECSETISGIEIEKCSSFKLSPLEPYCLKIIDCYKSSIEIILNKNCNLNKFQILNEQSMITTSFLP